MRTTLLLLALTGPAWAQSGGGFTGATAPKGGFTGPSSAVTTVEQVRGMRDDTPVILRGHIEKHLGGDLYLFRDATGTIQVDIDDDDWGGQTVGPKDQVELHGEVDKDWNSVQIDVDRLRKV